MAATEHGVRSMLDIPCGDFNWIHEFLDAHPALAYHGFDIVPAIVSSNRARHPGRTFSELDITTTTPPRADLVFCKDLLNHLSFDDVHRALANIVASGSTWLLASNNFGQANVELPGGMLGESRLLDITAEPMCYAAPRWNTHYLGLWKVSDLQRT